VLPACSLQARPLWASRISSRLPPLPRALSGGVSSMSTVNCKQDSLVECCRSANGRTRAHRHFIGRLHLPAAAAGSLSLCLCLCLCLLRRAQSQPSGPHCLVYCAAAKAASLNSLVWLSLFLSVSGPRELTQSASATRSQISTARRLEMTTTKRRRRTSSGIAKLPPPWPGNNNKRHCRLRVARHTR